MKAPGVLFIRIALYVCIQHMFNEAGASSVNNNTLSEGDIAFVNIVGTTVILTILQKKDDVDQGKKTLKQKHFL